MADELEQKKQNTEQEAQERLFRQEEVNRIIAERLAREQEKYKDYEELKKAAQRLKEIEDANKSEVEKAKQEAEQLKKMLEEKEREKQKILIENLKLQILDEAGLPKSWAKRILGESEDQIRADVEELKSLLKDKTLNVGKVVGGEPQMPDFDKMSLEEYEEWRKKQKK